MGLSFNRQEIYNILYDIGAANYNPEHITVCRDSQGREYPGLRSSTIKRLSNENPPEHVFGGPGSTDKCLANFLKSNEGTVKELAKNPRIYEALQTIKRTTSLTESHNVAADMLKNISKPESGYKPPS